MFPATHLHSALIQIRQNDMARAVETGRFDSVARTAHRFSGFVVGSQARGWIGRQLRSGRGA
jgi:hypothetical protein